MPLDARDRAILVVLAKEGRITNQALAARVHLSPSACHERVRRLEAEGVIRGYRAEIAWPEPVTLVHVEVTLETHAAGDFARFERAVQATPEIVACDAVAGGVDYLLTVAASDIADYQAVMDRLLESRLGIARYFTYVVTKRVKQS